MMASQRQLNDGTGMIRTVEWEMLDKVINSSLEIGPSFGKWTNEFAEN